MTTAPAPQAATVPSQRQVPEQPTPGSPTAGVLAAVWCRSVGAFWTLELRELDDGSTPGTITDWITSGLPISQPEPPEALARVLLAERGLQLFTDPSVGPCTHNRRGIGYASTDTEPSTLAHVVRGDAAEAAARLDQRAGRHEHRHQPRRAVVRRWTGNGTRRRVGRPERQVDQEDGSLSGAGQVGGDEQAAK
ncbi:MAG: hypothetical protein ACRDRO_15190 [Pseudonocardiaceae bacterium]